MPVALGVVVAARRGMRDVETRHVTDNKPVIRFCLEAWSDGLGSGLKVEYQIWRVGTPKASGSATGWPREDDLLRVRLEVSLPGSRGWGVVVPSLRSPVVVLGRELNSKHGWGGPPDSCGRVRRSHTVETEDVAQAVRELRAMVETITTTLRGVLEVRAVRLAARKATRRRAREVRNAT